MLCATACLSSNRCNLHFLCQWCALCSFYCSRVHNNCLYIVYNKVNEIVAANCICIYFKHFNAGKKDTLIAFVAISIGICC